MADELMSKVRRDLKAIRTVTITLRYSDMRDVSHGITLSAPTDLETDVYPLLPALLRETWSRRASLRLAGLRFTNIVDPTIQGELLLDPIDEKRLKQKQAADLLDTMRARSLSIMRAHSLPRQES
jgi:DNA polymerase-4